MEDTQQHSPFATCNHNYVILAISLQLIQCARSLLILHTWTYSFGTQTMALVILAIVEGVG